MSDQPSAFVAHDGKQYQGPPPAGWWQANDGRWYPPQAAQQPPTPAPPTPTGPPTPQPGATNGQQPMYPGPEAGQPWWKRPWVLAAAGVFVVLALVVSLFDDPDETSTAAGDGAEQTTTSADTTTTAPPATEPAVQDFATGDWAARVAEIAASDTSPTEKHDAVIWLSDEFVMDEAAIAQQLEYIVGEFRSGDYITRLTEEEYAVTNMFIALTLEQSASDPEVAGLAFDFFQNTKYVYRGVDAPGSEPVLANERQIEAAIASLGLG